MRVVLIFHLPLSKKIESISDQRELFLQKRFWRLEGTQMKKHSKVKIKQMCYGMKLTNLNI